MIRIIAGKHRTRQFHRPPENITRPSTDRLREAMFNILTHGFSLFQNGHEKGITVLDAFAGSGILGAEALSRGASFVYFVEKSHKTFKILKDNITSLKSTDETFLICADLFTQTMVPEKPLNLIILDPPYNRIDLCELFQLLINRNWVDVNTVISLETPKDSAPFAIDSFEKIQEQNYASSCLSFWQKV